jgi:hypothetical protein
MRLEPNCVILQTFAVAPDGQTELNREPGNAIERIIYNDWWICEKIRPALQAAAPTGIKIVQPKLHIAKVVNAAGEDRAEAVAFLNNEGRIFAREGVIRAAVRRIHEQPGDLSWQALG